MLPQDFWRFCPWHTVFCYPPPPHRPSRTSKSLFNLRFCIPITWWTGHPCAMSSSTLTCMPPHSKSYHHSHTQVIHGEVLEKHGVSSSCRSESWAQQTPSEHRSKRRSRWQYRNPRLWHRRHVGNSYGKRCPVWSWWVQRLFLWKHSSEGGLSYWSIYYTVERTLEKAILCPCVCITHLPKEVLAGAESFLIQKETQESIVVTEEGT